MSVINSIIKPAVRWVAKRSSVADRLVGILRRSVQATRYLVARLMNRQDPKTVLFMSFGGRSISDSPKEIFLEMVSDSRFDDWEFVWALKEPAFSKFAEMKADGPVHAFFPGEDEREIRKRVRTVGYEKNDFYAALATSKWWTTNFRSPEGVKPAASVNYVQTWHGAPIKRLGADIQVEKSYPTKKRAALIEWYKMEAAKWSVLVSQSDYLTTKLWSAFAIDELSRKPQVITEGSPRNVPLAKATADEQTAIRHRLSLPPGKKVALYAPTFRDNQHTSKLGHTYSLGLNFAELQAALGDEWIVLFRVHYLVNNAIDVSALGDFVKNMSSYEDINDLYIAADVLISDYSSSIVDFTVTRKPIVIYAYDLDEYENSMRGFYIPTTAFPGPILRTQSELIEALRDLDAVNAEWSGRRDAFAHTMTGNDDAATAKRVVSRVFAGELVD